MTTLMWPIKPKVSLSSLLLVAISASFIYFSLSLFLSLLILGFPGGPVVRNLPVQRHGFPPSSGKIPYAIGQLRPWAAASEGCVPWSRCSTMKPPQWKAQAPQQRRAPTQQARGSPHTATRSSENATPTYDKNSQESRHRRNIPQHKKSHIQQTHNKHLQWQKAESISFKIRNKKSHSHYYYSTRF